MDISPAQIQSAFQGAKIQGIIISILTSLQVGSLITWGLHGILCVQVYNYYLSFPSDKLHMKLLVYCALITETIQTILVTRDTYKIFVLGFGNYLGILETMHMLPLTIPIIGGLIGLLCHLTFAYRIMQLSKSRIVGGVITALSLGTGISAFIFGAKLFDAGSLIEAAFMPGIYISAGLWNGFGAACDIIIAACMTYFLSSKKHTGFRNTDLIVTRVIRLTIETGIVTATSSAASAILFIGFRHDPNISIYFVIPAILITKMYSVTILATFNNRQNAVGGPPPLADSENCFDTSKAMSRNLDHTLGEIRIGRTVVKQVWEDDVPMSHLQIRNSGDSIGSLGDDVQSSTSKEVPGGLLKPQRL